MVSRGRGNLTVIREVEIKHPILNETAIIRQGEVLPTLHWIIDKGVVTLTLDDETIKSSNGEERNTWQLPEDAISFAPALPEDNGVIRTPIGKPALVYPSRWMPHNIGAFIKCSIIPEGHFTWWEATHGGTRIPHTQEMVDAVVRLAKHAEQARRQIGKPFNITSWIRFPTHNRACGGAYNSRHLRGDAMDFVVEGYSGLQLYRAFDGWWMGGLGLYGGSRRNICHLDARVDKHGRLQKARWKH